MPVTVTSKELREKRAAIADELRTLSESGIGDKKQFTEEQQKRWDEATAEYDARTKEIAIAERLEAMDADQRVTTIAHPGLAAVDGSRELSDATGGGSGGTLESDRSLAVQSWFRCNAVEPRDLTTEQEAACKRVGMNPRSAQLRIKLLPTEAVRKMQRAGYVGGYGRSFSGAEDRALSAVTAGTGGVLVPETLVNQIEINLLAYGGIMQTAEIMRTASGEPINWPAADDTSNTGALIGESTAVTTTAQPTFKIITWNAYKVTSQAILVPTELYEDAPFNLVSWLGEALGTRIARKVNALFTTGNGAAQPKGLVTAASAGVTAASATAIAWSELDDLIHSIDPAYRVGPGVGFMFHDNIMLHLRKLVDGIGRPLWAAEPNGAPPATLKGYPYFINQDMASSVATTNVTMLFGQLNKYKVRMVNDVRFYRLQERYREYDQDGFMSFARMDGNLLDAGTAPVKKLTQA